MKNPRFPLNRLKPQSNPGVEVSPLAGDGEAALTSHPARFLLSPARRCPSFCGVRRRRQVCAWLSDGEGKRPRLFRECRWCWAPVGRPGGAGGGDAPPPRLLLSRPRGRGSSPAPAPFWGQRQHRTSSLCLSGRGSSAPSLSLSLGKLSSSLGGLWFPPSPRGGGRAGKS